VAPRGLDPAEAKARLEAEGPNTLPQQDRRSVLRIAFDVLREPMFLLLFASATLYVIFGDIREALTLAGFVVVVMVITILQEGRTERALDALRDLSSPRALVLRGGVPIVIPGREVVRGDIVRIAEGDRIPADGVVREGLVSVDESLLTGESVPVSKAPDATSFSGTLVVSGSAVIEIVATGPRSELGRIGTSLREVTSERTPLQKEIDSLVRRVAIGGLTIAAALVVVRGVLEHEWLRALLGGITLAMALLPEEFPVVLTVFLALGAWRISKHRVLTRRVAAVETLGSVTVLCTDKTGTLTYNRMTVRRLRTADADLEIPTAKSDEAAPPELPETVHALVEFAVLACARDPFDPMEKALLELGKQSLHGTEHLHPQWEMVRSYPLSAELLAVTHAWRAREAPALVVATKGAPEAVFDLCHLEPESPDGVAWRKRADAMARSGLRVIAVARSSERAADGQHHPVTASAPGDPHEVLFEMVGLVGLEDPVRRDAAAAVALCKQAGIRVVMITGDHPDTARTIAAAAGIDSPADVLTGPQIEAMDDAALAERLRDTTVVARAVPAHKLRIVRALEAQGHVVGMTGDGVNDAPALKAAHIGIAMGARGTDVAREASSLVLIDDDFGAIVAAVRMGRRIYDNVRKAVRYIVAVHVPIAGLSLIPALLGWGALLAPTHVVFLELIIDPSCSIVFEMEDEEPNIMGRPPRARTSRMLRARDVVWSLVQGLAVLLPALALVWLARRAGMDLAHQRTMAFLALVLGNLAAILVNRSASGTFLRALGRSNPALRWLLVGVVAALAAMLFFPPARSLFDFAALTPIECAKSAAAGVLPVLLLDLVRGGWRSPPA
jgi:Ca2+-transporting ATPase